MSGQCWDVYVKCGKLSDGRDVFDKMPRRIVLSGNAMILGYAQMEESTEALELYPAHAAGRGAPDDRRVVSSLKALSCLAAREDRTKAEMIVRPCIPALNSESVDAVLIS